MSGYNYLNWKSNNAIEAEKGGLIKAGQLARRLCVSIAAVKAKISPQEWHHVGGGYAKVNYYQRTPPDWQVEAAREYDQAHRPQSWPSATVRLLKWPKFKVGRFARNNSRPTEVVHENVRVTRATPNTYKILLDDGREIIKRATTKGLVIRVGNNEIVNNDTWWM